MPDLSALETDLRSSLPPELAVLAPDLARTLQAVALGQVSVEQARFLLGQPTTLAILREMLATPGAASPAAITVGDIYNSHGVAIGPNARVVYQGPGYPRPDYRTEIANRLAHLQQTFVGRGDLLTDLTAAHHGGYTVLMAPAGYGKSAVMAQLVARHDCGDWAVTLCFVFLRQETGENTPVFFLQRLNAQLLTVLGIEGGVPGDLEALRAQFSALWARLLETVPGPVAILVDGLDEMAPGPVSVAAVLPDRLAPNVQILVTSRPSPDPRDAVPAGHPLPAGRFLTLAGFTTADLVDLLTRLGASSATALALAPGILTLTRGEPLLARFVAEESAAAGAIPSTLRDDAPKGVRAYFARQVDQLIAVGDSTLTRDVLGTLCVARGGLSRRDLAEVLGAEPLDVGKVLEPARRFLLGQERLELMHLELREALQDEFSPKHLRVCTDRVLTWCAAQAQAGWPARTPRYALEHYAHHLDAAGDRAARLALVTDPAFRAAQWQGLGDIGRTLEDVRAALVDALDADDVVGVVTCAAAYRETLRHGQVGEAVFAALDSGDPPQALHRAAICGNDAEWAQVLWAYLAWEYATRGQVAEVQRALGGLGRAAAPPLDSLIEALLAATARALDGQAGRAATDWLTSWGRTGADDLLAAYPEATAADHQSVMTTIDGLRPMADHLIQQIENDARSGMYEAVAYIETGNEEESLRIRDLRARLATVTALPEGRVLVERLLRATLFNPYPFYRDQAVATLGVAALAAPQDSEARAWLRRQMRAMLGVALTGEGVTFTFELPAQLLAFKPAPSLSVGELEGVLGRGRYLVDRWGSHLRARLADVGALARLSEVPSTTAHDGLAEALERPVGYAGFAVLTFLAVVDLCRELGLDPQNLTSRRDGLDQPLLEAALSSAGAVRDPDFRARRALLVHLYRAQWLGAPPPAPSGLAERLAALPERDIRLAYLAHLSAVWSAPGAVDREGLKALVPFALSDATTLDLVLARLIGTRPQRPTAAEVEAMAVACARDLATGRPWDYSAKIAPDEPNVVP